jgi:uncharacterized protein
MRALFDVNVLIAMFDAQHAHHARAHQWWATNQTEGWASCPLTQNGFVRVTTHPSYPNRTAIRNAIELFERQILATDHAFWSDDISLLDPRLFDRERILGPKQLTDIYLLALAVRNGGRLVTFDRAVPTATVLGAAVESLVMI